MINDFLSNKSLLESILIHSKSPKNSVEIINPANLDIIAYIHKNSVIELRNIIENAEISFQTWKSISFEIKYKLLIKWANLILLNKEDLSRIITLEQGKNLKESSIEIESCISMIKWFAEETKRIYGKTIPCKDINQQILVEYQPIGLVGAIIPWNFPASMLIRKTAPALAAGCGIIVKPSELTPLSSFAIHKLAVDAGIPRNLLNIVCGDSVKIGKELTNNLKIKKISFTGSTKVGKELIKQSSTTVKRMSMELGGDAAFIIFADSDIEKTVNDLILAKLRNNGQTCIAPNKIFIEENIFEKYLDKIISKLRNIQSYGKDFDIGPLISESHQKRITHLLDEALKFGAEIHYRKKISQKKGYFFGPVVISLDINSDAKINREEIFGPIFNLYRFKNEEELLYQINKSEYGLASYLYTKDYARINRMVKAIESGMIGVNEWAISNEMAPFGGIKQSGFGREGSYLGIFDYLNVKYICTNFS